MIEGMKFHLKGRELSDMLAKRAGWHRERVESLKLNLKQAEESMAAAGAAAASSVPWARARRPSGGFEGLVASAAPRRNYGGDMEDPVEAIRQAIIFHTNRAAQLTFYSRYLKMDATYVLTESDISRYELVEQLEIELTDSPVFE